MNTLIKWLVISLVIISLAYVSPGIQVESFLVALVAAVVLGLVTAVLRPILLILTLPINVVTLGLFTFIINSFLVILTSKIVPGFSVGNFWWALLLSLAISVVNVALEKENKRG